MERFFPTPYARPLISVTVLVTILSTIAPKSSALEISSSVNPVGSGARAMGMGGAFIAFADDATATSWNPAGLINIRNTEVSVVGSSFARNHEYDSTSNPEITSSHSVDVTNLNFFSISQPLRFKSFTALSWSVSYQNSFELAKSIDYAFNRNSLDGTTREQINFEQTGNLGAFSLSASYYLTPYSVGLGVAVNRWSSDFMANDWHTRFTSQSITGTGINAISSNRMENNRITFEGNNITIGVLWKLWEMESRSVKTGFVYKSRFGANITAEENIRETVVNSNRSNTNLSSSISKVILQMPDSIGLGIAYKHSDSLLFALDAYRTNWSEHLVRTSNGSILNPLNLSQLDRGRLSDTTQVRIGLEKTLFRHRYLLSLRSGFFYDPQPGIDTTDEYYGATAGIGYSNNRFAYDAAYNIRHGTNVSSDLYLLRDSTMNVTQHNLLFSAILYF